MPHTQKSFKSTKRDKFRHSGNFHKAGPRKGGLMELGNPMDDQWETEEDYPEESWWQPEAKAQRKFDNAAEGLAAFKTALKRLLDLYFTSQVNMDDFVTELQAIPHFSLYVPEVPKMAMSRSFDKSDTARVEVSTLLTHLHLEGVISSRQIAMAFRKLYNRYPELRLDVPEVLTFMNEFAEDLISANALQAAEHKEMVDEVKSLQTLDPEALQLFKQKISILINEYFASTDVDEFIQGIQGCNSPALHYEVVKRIVRTAFDKNNHECYLTSLFLARASGSLLTEPQIEKGFQILLEGVEDIQLDVPKVLPLLALFLARGVVDEIISPGFLKRVDLVKADLGASVVQQALILLNTQRQSLETCWASPAVRQAEADAEAELDE